MTVLASCQGFLFFLHSAPLKNESRLGAGKNLGGNTEGQVIQIVRMDILCHITWCWAVKTGVEEEGEGLSRVAIVLRLVGYLFACGRKRVIVFASLWISCFAGAHPQPQPFPSPAQLSLSWLHVSCIFLSYILPFLRNEQVALKVLGCWQDSTHTTCLLLKPSDGWNTCVRKLIYKDRSEVQPLSKSRATSTYEDNDYLEMVSLLFIKCGNGEMRTKVTFYHWKIRAQSSGIRPNKIVQ